MFYKQDPTIKHKYSRRKTAKFRYVSDDRISKGIRLLTENGYIILTEDGQEILVDV